MPDTEHIYIDSTTTQAMMWQIDCEKFLQSGCAWELRDVTTEEHGTFVMNFAYRNHLTFTRKGTGVRFVGKKTK
jgi:hypothetical protein